MIQRILIYFRLIRPYQWVKNLFCFSGVVFGLHFEEPNLWILSSLAFIVFCLSASSVYILNDIIDIESDKIHPTKKNRPIAAGKITINQAYVLFGSLLTIAFILATLIGKSLVFVILIYVVMNVYYSNIGKHIVIFDVFIISIGFLLRVFAGTVCIGIDISEWLILCVMMLTLFLGFAKRRAELLNCERVNQQTKNQRMVLEKYDPRILDIFIAISACSSILSYALFIVINKSDSHIIYTIIFVIYGIFRYIFLLYSHGGGQDTANDLLDDKHLISTLVLWLASYIAILLLL